MTPVFQDDSYLEAVRRFRSGDLRQAETLLRSRLQANPGHADAWRLLAMVAYRMGRPEEAAEIIGRAIQLKPENAELHGNLGVFLAGSGRLAEAIAAFRKACELDPVSAEAHYNLGNAFKDAGDLPAAIEAYLRASQLNPADVRVQNNLASALQDLGRYDEAIRYFRQAIALRPADVELRQRLAAVLQSAGQVDQAVTELHHAAELAPNSPSVYCGLGDALRSKGLFDQARAAFGKALRLRPDFPEALSGLASVLMETARLDEAMAAARQAVAAYQIRRRQPADDARFAEDFRAESRVAGNLLFMTLLHPDYDGARICEEHRRWNERYGKPLASAIEPHGNDPEPHRKLRIGYVSADFRNHPAGHTLLGPLREHNHSQFEIHCYSSVPVADAITDHFRSYADVWRDVRSMPDEELARLIRSDRIDVLVDLGVHSSGNRLLAFARKPAPVQVTFAGYPGTTGLDAIKYRLTDDYLDPPGEHESHYTEQSIRLPHSFWCYDPASEEPPVTPLPALQNGRITFGCLNSFSKINRGMLEVWGRVLVATPDSRLVLLSGQGSHRDWALAILQSTGVEANRVEFLERRRRPRYLELYHLIDIGLDTLPWNGHVTSLDAFWMGVPVVTLVGQAAVGRAGLSLAANLGMMELVSRTEGEFVSRAVSLASDLPRLAQLRATLRARFRASPLMDHTGQSRALEAVYRRVWVEWCDKRRQE